MRNYCDSCRTRRIRNQVEPSCLDGLDAVKQSLMGFYIAVWISVMGPPGFTKGGWTSRLLQNEAFWMFQVRDTPQFPKVRT